VLISKVDDVLIGIDDKPIHKFADLQEALAKHRPGDKVKVKLVRDKKEKTVEVTLKNEQGTTKVVKRCWNGYSWCSLPSYT